MKYLISIIIVTLLSGCGSGDKMKELNKNALEGKWELKVLNGKEIESENAIYIEFTEGDKLSGYAGCNRIFGSFTTQDENEVKFNQIVSTRMACAEPVMNTERAILELLNSTERYTHEDGKLFFSKDGKAINATFIEMKESEIVNKYWKLIKLDGELVVMNEKQEREQYFILRNDGGLSGFTGCNQFNGQYELSEGNRITFSENMTMTLMACPDFDIIESAFLQVFKQADTYSFKNDTLSLGLDEGTPLAEFEVVYF